MSERKIDVQVDIYTVDLTVEGTDEWQNRFIAFSPDEAIELADKFTEAKHIIQGGCEKVTIQACDLQPEDRIESLSVSVEYVRAEVNGEVNIKVKNTEGRLFTLWLPYNLSVTVLRKIQ